MKTHIYCAGIALASSLPVIGCSLDDDAREQTDNGQDLGQEALALGEAPRVEVLDHRLQDGVFTIDLAVRNVTYDKSCGVVVTGDSWLTREIGPARYVGPDAGDAAAADAELWRVSLASSTLTWRFVGQAAVIEYAAFCYFGGVPVAYWDNAGGANHRFDRGWPVVGGAQLDIDATQQVVVAPDGRVFVAAGDSWYGAGRYVHGLRVDPGGTVVTDFVVDTGETRIRNIHHVAALDLILVDMWTENDYPNHRWLAIDAAGAILWDETAALDDVYGISAKGDAVLLRGRGGVGVATAAGLAVIGPDTGCVDTPIVHDSGRFACDTYGGVAVLDALAADDVAAASVLPGGTPWAVDEQVVVVSDSSAGTLTAYDVDGGALWTHDVGYLSTHYAPPPVSSRCANYAAGGVLAYVERRYDGGETTTRFRLVDTDTGVALVDRDAGSLGAPCPYADGFFYATDYRSYSSQLVRIAPDGVTRRLDIGGGMNHFEVVGDGTLLLQLSRPYRPDQQDGLDERTVIVGADYREVYSGAFDLSYPPGSPAIGFGGGTLATALGGQVTITDFEVDPAQAATSDAANPGK